MAMKPTTEPGRQPADETPDPDTLTPDTASSLDEEQSEQAVPKVHRNE